MLSEPGGGGGTHPKYLVGMCRGKVKNGGFRIELECMLGSGRARERVRENAVLRSELGEVERENVGLRNGL